jgi:hypothetical protein
VFDNYSRLEGRINGHCAKCLGVITVGQSPKLKSLDRFTATNCSGSTALALATFGNPRN